MEQEEILNELYESLGYWLDKLEECKDYQIVLYEHIEVMEVRICEMLIEMGRVEEANELKLKWRVGGE